MLGMLWMDLKRMRWWLLLGVLWTTGVTFFTYTLELSLCLSPVSILIYLLFPLYAMAFIKGQVLSDTQSGWSTYVATFPHGLRKYAIEKYLLLLCFIPVLAVGRCAGTLLYDYWKYGEWMLGKYILYYVSWTKLSVFFFGFAALLMPVLLHSPKRYAKWETIVWVVLLPLTILLYDVDVFAYHAERYQGNLISPQAFQETNHIAWYNLPWEQLRWIVILLFLVTGLFTIWKMEKRSSITELQRKAQKRGKSLVTLCLILLISLLAVWMVEEHTPKSFLYVYSKPNWKGTTTNLITNSTPEKVAEKAEFAGYTYRTHYEGKTYSVRQCGSIGEKLLLWDEEWLLWDMDTHEIQNVSIPYSPDTSDEEIHYHVYAIDSEEPMAVFITKISEEFLGIGFFSIPEDRMITDFVYQNCKDELIDGKIAAKTEEGSWVLLDPYTGEIVEMRSEELEIRNEE